MADILSKNKRGTDEIGEIKKWKSKWRLMTYTDMVSLMLVYWGL